MQLLNTDVKNAVLASMERILDNQRNKLLTANQKDLEAFDRDDQALYDRLVVNDKKIDQMIIAVQEVRKQEDPVNRNISQKELENGLKIINKTAPFGSILIIYESRPDVTVEAAVLAFKANNKIFLKGGREALHSNTTLVEFWHQALQQNNLDTSYIDLLNLNREATQQFLKNPPERLDLIVPRGGEKLIDFVKKYANCAVLVSGRGNNFLYVHPEADWQKSLAVIVNAKTDKISACNALDKVLIDSRIEDCDEKIKQLSIALQQKKVEVLVDSEIKQVPENAKAIDDRTVWEEEFLAMKCLIGTVASLDEAIDKINTLSGGHSATIMTEDHAAAKKFMQGVDCAAVYLNASTRFTDGGQMGVGAELAISTDKLHHRGPLGLQQLVTNKYHVYGNGQVRT